MSRTAGEGLDIDPTVDVSAAFHVVGQPRAGLYFVSLDLWRILAGDGLALSTFARVAADSVSGRREPFNNADKGRRVNWVPLPGGERAFAFEGVWVLARIAGCRCTFDLVPEATVKEHFLAAIEKECEKLEAIGRLRRAGIRNGKVVWVGVRPS
jgi:hypothetical protein